MYAGNNQFQHTPRLSPEAQRAIGRVERARYYPSLLSAIIVPRRTRVAETIIMNDHRSYLEGLARVADRSVVMTPEPILERPTMDTVVQPQTERPFDYELDDPDLELSEIEKIRRNIDAIYRESGDPVIQREIAMLPDKPYHLND